MEHIKHHIVDLAKIQGEGQFNCPECRTKISPDDETEDTYTILDTVMKREHLEELTLRCNRCRSRIHVIGFQSHTK